MKSEFFTRGKLISGLGVMLFSSVVMAGAEPLDPTWVRPDTDFSKYTKFLVKPLNLSDVKILRPSWAQDDPIEWKLETMALGSGEITGTAELRDSTSRSLLARQDYTKSSPGVY